MTPDQVKRKLAAILSADVKGYSRLMGEDEEWTLRTLNSYKVLIRNLVGEHRGRVVGSPGDNVLAEFASVVDAVECAVEIQQVLRAKNALLPETRKMDFRIGINLGDVIEEEDSIYGDGVNIAARLEGLADPGGICISGSAYEQIENKIPLHYDYLGEHEVKNIAKPVRVYRARIEPEEAPSPVPEEKKPERKKLSRAVLASIALVLIAGVALLYQFAFRPSAPKTEVAFKEKMAYPLPDVPSIAVLPFANMSGDPKQEFFSDGITEDIITALSKVPKLFVIARNSTFTYKGKPVKVERVSEELGVRYVLEGSVQRSADRIRINAQLIDALTGQHLWAERYDRDLKDLFALQDEITMKILTAIQVKLTVGEQVIGYEKYFKGKKGLDCYMKYLQGNSAMNEGSIDGTRAGRRFAEEAIEMCPENPMVYAIMSRVNWWEYLMGLGKSPQESIEKGMEMAQKALAMDDSTPQAHAILGLFYYLKSEYDKAIAEAERAVAIEPGSAYSYNNYGLILTRAGRPEEAIPVLQKAIRLNPVGDSFTFSNLGDAYRMTGRFEEAVSAYKKALQREPNYFFAHLNLAGTYSMMGLEREARTQAAEVLRINPKFSLDSAAKRITSKDQSKVDKYLEALRKAGLK